MNALPIILAKQFDIGGEAYLMLAGLLVLLLGYIVAFILTLVNIISNKRKNQTVLTIISGVCTLFSLLFIYVSIKGALIFMLCTFSLVVMQIINYYQTKEIKS